MSVFNPDDPEDIELVRLQREMEAAKKQQGKKGGGVRPARISGAIEQIVAREILRKCTTPGEVVDEEAAQTSIAAAAAAATRRGWKPRPRLTASLRDLNFVIRSVHVTHNLSAATVLWTISSKQAQGSAQTDGEEEEDNGAKRRDFLQSLRLNAKGGAETAAAQKVVPASSPSSSSFAAERDAFDEDILRSVIDDAPSVSAIAATVARPQGDITAGTGLSRRSMAKLQRQAESEADPNFAQRKVVQTWLEHHSPSMRYAIGKRLRWIRYVPKLIFAYDSGYEQTRKRVQVLKEVQSRIE